MVMRSGRLALAAVAVAFVAVLLSGCSGGEPMPVPSTSPSRTPTPSPSPTAKAPIFHPDGSAAANQQYFDYVNRAWNAQYGLSDGQSIVNNLVAAGFTKTDMEVTFDTTAIDLTVDSIQVAVRIKDECLIGGFSYVGYQGLLAPLLGTGTCLIGETRPIDW
ncbi:MAG: DUF6993 domain-containing protein [Rhodoglobus sp.]